MDRGQGGRPGGPPRGGDRDRGGPGGGRFGGDRFGGDRFGGGDRGGPPPIKEYYYRNRLAPKGPPPVPGEHFQRRTGGLDGKLVLKLTCVTPVHIGTGLTGLEGGRAIMLTARDGERPVIPGSAVKGAFRITGEALARSCHDQRCRSCYPCLVFGSVGFRGRVTFASAAPEGGLRPLGFMLPMRTSRGPTWDETKIRLYNHRKAQPDPRGIELVETLPAGATLRLELTYTGLERAALGYLLLVTGAAKDHGFLHKIGAAKSQGLGSVKVEIAEHTVRRIARELPVIASTEAPAADELVRAYLDAEKPHDSGNQITGTLETLREKSRPLEVELP
jgi:CRISPR/Cas system CSM-associated protein Csm3 (group 7 of RAMP superfamily)